MGGKKYNKDGSKKPPTQTAPSTSGQQQQQQQQPSARPSTSSGRGQQLTAAAAGGEPEIRQSLGQLVVTMPPTPSGRSEPKQQQQQKQPRQQQQQKQQQLPPSQQQSGGPIRKGQQQQQQQRAVPEQQPQRRDQPRGQQKGTMNRPPVLERNRTQGPSQHHTQVPSSSMPVGQPPRNLPRAEPKQSIASSSSTGTARGGGAILKASEIEKTITQKPTTAKPENLRELRMPSKEPGKRGEPLGLIETNYLQLDISKIVENVYKYDVEIQINRGPKKLNSAAFLAFRAEFLPNERGISYDWKKIALTNRPLNIGGELVGDVQIRHPDTGKLLDCNVTIKPAKEGRAIVPIRHELNNYSREHIEETMQALDIILKSVYDQHLGRGVRGGRSFFFSPRDGLRLPDLKEFAELRKGLFQSVVLGENMKALLPLLNVDVANKAFPKPYSSLIHLLEDMRNEYSTRNRAYVVDLQSPLHQDATKKLHAHLSGLDLCYCSDGTNRIIRKYFELGKPPAQETFEIDRDGRRTRTTVQQYFDVELRRQIRYPHLQCIRLGHRDRYISVPMEYCAILGNQVVNKKCTEKQTAEMIRYTAVSTAERKANIVEQTHSIQYNRSDTLRAFGINVDDSNFLKVQARQLPPPDIQYKNGKAKPSKGAWRMDFGRTPLTFLQPVDCLKWCVLNTDTYLNGANLDSFVSELHRVSGSTGIRLEKHPLDIVYQCRPQEISRQLSQIASLKPNIVFCVVPPKSANYAKIKQDAELRLGVLTQCIKSDTVSRRGTDRQTLLNILLKVNAKLNGVNHQLAPQLAPILNNFDKEPVMFIGADVTHPAPGVANGYSVAAAVASHDRNAFCYNAGWRPQIGEIVVDFRTFVKDALLFFRNKNGKLPTKIFYYRDGVSDSQFKHVMEVEYDAILKACADITNGYDDTVKVTIIIVQKRHHTRFFPIDKRICEDRNGNVPAGTIVDTTITRPDEPQYYLASHQAIQGVTRPTKYCVILDDGDHTMDDLQALTYALCHMFARCNRSVSYPSPTYYAHLAAARGKVHLTDVYLDADKLDTYEQRPVLIKDTFPMFFI